MRPSGELADLKLGRNWSFPKETAGFSKSQKGTLVQRFLENSTLWLLLPLRSTSQHILRNV